MNGPALPATRSGASGVNPGIPDIHVLARTVMVVDKDNVIRYLQVVPELASMPDMDAAFNAARKVAGLSLPLPPMGQMGGFTY